MQGRATAWATTLPNGVEAAVRHSQHGGLLARLTGDWFLAPTRAPRELAAALRLANAGVPTPDVLAYAVYPAFGPFVRADVATRLLHGRALPDAWVAATTDGARWALVEALAGLLGALRQAGALHPDLNVRNVFIVDAVSGPAAAVLDVDRVVFGAPGSAGLAEQNLQRLVRSMQKASTGGAVNLTSQQHQRLRTAVGSAQ
jgi:3-deoxy-D-manno-octulosonic acid kinase